LDLKVESYYVIIIIFVLILIYIKYNNNKYYILEVKINACTWSVDED